MKLQDFNRRCKAGKMPAPQAVARQDACPNTDEWRWFLRGGLCFLGVLGFWLGVPVGAVMARERGVGAGLVGAGLSNLSAGVINLEEPARTRVCGGDFEGLVGLLVRDLPGYANREFRRSKVPGDRSRPSYMVIAGRPEFEPLPLGVGRSEGGVSGDGVRQVFVTTLERSYVGDEVVQLQGYHWLFLTETEGGWRLVMMFSRFGGYPTRGPVSPPQDTSNGAIAGAVRAWLRDCRAGSVRG